MKQLTNKSQDKPTAAPRYPTSLNPAGITINAMPIYILQMLMKIWKNDCY